MVRLLFNGFNRIGSEWIMYILVMLSVISLAIILDRFKYFRQQERTSARLWKDQLQGWMKNSTVTNTGSNIAEMVKVYPCLESGLLEVLLQARQKGHSDLKLLMTSYLGLKRIEMDQYLSFLGTLGSNAPFIGLFGTILGIIQAFHEISEGNTMVSGAQSVSTGLSEALVATSIGLMVAIPAVLFFNLFQRKIKKILARTESLGNFMISLKS